MAGHRRGTGKPLRSVRRAANQLRWYRQQLRKAQTPTDRIGRAADYLRARMDDLSDREAAAVANRAVDFLTGLADQIKTKAE